MNKNSFLPDWRDGGVRDEWAEELLKESCAAEVRNYVRELDGYRYADGPDGRGYYRQQPEEPKQDDYDELMRMAMGT